MTKDDWLWDWLEKHCPRILLSEATHFVEKIKSIEQERYDLARCVGILTETKLGISQNGALPDISKDRPAVQWAMKYAQYTHAGWVCGPVGEGIETLMEETEKKSHEKS